MQQKGKNLLEKGSWQKADQRPVCTNRSLWKLACKTHLCTPAKNTPRWSRASRRRPLVPPGEFVNGKAFHVTWPSSLEHAGKRGAKSNLSAITLAEISFSLTLAPSIEGQVQERALVFDLEKFEPLT